MNVIVNGFSMAYTTAGQGRPLVLVHGFPLNRQMWQPQVEGLSSHGQVIAPDLRSHGDSQMVPGPYSIDLFADDLNAFLDAAGIDDKIVLGGLSMGGYVAFAFYRKYAQRLRGLILTATRAAPDSPQARASRDQAIATASEKGTGPIIESMAEKLVSPQTIQKRPQLVETAKTIMRGTLVETMIGDLGALKERADSRPTLEKIDVPTMIVHGVDDQIIPLAEAQEMQAGIAGARLVAIPEAGHLLNLEQAEIFNQAVQEFLLEI